MNKLEALDVQVDTLQQLIDISEGGSEVVAWLERSIITAKANFILEHVSEREELDDIVRMIKEKSQ